MGSYLVHIYRRDICGESLNSTEVFGVVEGVESKQQVPFTSADELWSIVTGKKLAGVISGKSVSRKTEGKEND